MAWRRNKKTGGLFEVPDEEVTTNQYMNNKIKSSAKETSKKTNTKKLSVKDTLERFEKIKESKYGATKEETEAMKEEIKKLLDDLDKGTELGMVKTDTRSTWTSYGEVTREETEVIKYTKLGTDVWRVGDNTLISKDVAMKVLWNDEPLRDIKTANKIKEEKAKGDRIFKRDITNIGTDKWGNKVGTSSNEVVYKNDSMNEIIRKKAKKLD